MDEEWIVLGDSSSGSDTASDDGSESGFSIVRARRNDGDRRAAPVAPVVVSDAPASPPRSPPRAAVPQPTPPGLFKVVSFGEAFLPLSSENAGSHGDEAGDVEEEEEEEEEEDEEEEEEEEEVVAREYGEEEAGDSDESDHSTSCGSNEAHPVSASMHDDDDDAESSTEEGRVASDDGEEDVEPEAPWECSDCERLWRDYHHGTEMVAEESDSDDSFGLETLFPVSDTEHIVARDGGHGGAESEFEATASNANEVPPERRGCGGYDDIDESSVSDEEAENNYGYIDIVPSQVRDDGREVRTTNNATPSGVEKVKFVGRRSYDDIDTSDESDYDEDDDGGSSEEEDSSGTEESSSDEDDDEESSSNEEESSYDEDDEDSDDVEGSNDDEVDDSDCSGTEESTCDEDVDTWSSDAEESNSDVEDSSDAEDKGQLKKSYKNQARKRMRVTMDEDDVIFTVDEDDDDTITCAMNLFDCDEEDPMDTSDTTESDPSDSAGSDYDEEDETDISNTTGSDNDEDDDDIGNSTAEESDCDEDGDDTDSSITEESDCNEDGDSDSSIAEDSDFDSSDTDEDESSEGDGTDSSDEEEEAATFGRKYDDIDESSDDDEDDNTDSSGKEEEGTFGRKYDDIDESSDDNEDDDTDSSDKEKEHMFRRKYDDIDGSSDDGEESYSNNIASSGRKESVLSEFDALIGDGATYDNCPVCGHIVALKARGAQEFDRGNYDMFDSLAERQAEVICRKEPVEPVRGKYDDIDTEVAEDGGEVDGPNAELNGMASDEEQRPTGPAVLAEMKRQEVAQETLDDEMVRVAAAAASKAFESAQVVPEPSGVRRRAVAATGAAVSSCDETPASPAHVEQRSSRRHGSQEADYDLIDFLDDEIIVYSFVMFVFFLIMIWAS